MWPSTHALPGLQEAQVHQMIRSEFTLLEHEFGLPDQDYCDNDYDSLRHGGVFFGNLKAESR